MTKTAVLALLVLSLPSLGLADENWTSFQNGGQLSFPAERGFELNADSSPKWQVRLDGYGQSSPVKFGDLVYVTFVSGENKEQLHVWAIDFKSGEIAWKRNTKNSSPEKNDNYVSRAAPSPVCDANGVVAFFEGGNVVAYSPTGELRWERDLVTNYGEVKARHGLASSLEQSADGVFVWVERSVEPFVARLAKETGKTVWKSAGLGVTSWSSPRWFHLRTEDTIWL